MNQKFRPDCFVVVTIFNKGDPPKRSCGVALLDRNKKVFFEAAAFLGKSSFLDAQLRALHLGLSYAHKFRNEKIELLLSNKNLPKDEGIDGLLQNFSFWRVEQAKTEELELARVWAEKIFAK